MSSGNRKKETQFNLSKVTSPGVTRIFKGTSPGMTRIFMVTSPGVIRIFKLSSREMSEIGDASIVKIKITNQLTAKWLPLSKTRREYLATNASVSIAPEPNTEPTITRAVPCARFVTESITPPSVTASITSWGPRRGVFIVQRAT